MSEETMTPETGSGELTVRDAATQFEGFLSTGEESTDQPETVEAEATEEAEESTSEEEAEESPAEEEE